MNNRIRWSALLGCLALSACGGKQAETTSEKAKGEIEVKLCDNHTTVTVAADQTQTQAQGAAIAQALMAQWHVQHADSDWLENERKAHTLKPAHDNSALVDPAGDTYGRITQADVEIWRRETEKVALLGSRIFHSADELGSTIAVSCDMCHPHAANTHAETYPKFQKQLGRVALMRDMINWCIEHPVRGKALAADDPKMRALEAYIYAQRTGVPLNYGKH